MKPVLAQNKTCTGCLACHDVCRHDAIRIKNINGHQCVEVDEHACIECGLCERSCPVITPVEKNSPEEMVVYGGWATDEETRIDAASGGAFAGLAQSFFRLHDGEPVAVFGASLRDNRTYHVSIERAEDIPLLTNSKYIQSDTTGVYSAVSKMLRNGYWVMFSGCPCQIAGLYGFLGKKRDNDRLVTIEVVCHGIASPYALDIHLQHYHSQKIYKFRDKRQGTQDWKFSQCTTIDIEGKAVKMSRKEDVFYSIYAGWLLDRKCCSDCKFATLARTADITLADFWGLDVPEYYKQGVSLIIANNAKGDALINKSECIYVFRGEYKTAIMGNPNLFTGYKYIQYHPLVMWPDVMRKILPASVWKSIVTNRMPWKLLWAVYKIATKWHIRRSRKALLKTLYENPQYKNLLTPINLGG